MTLEASVIGFAPPGGPELLVILFIFLLLLIPVAAVAALVLLFRGRSSGSGDDERGDADPEVRRRVAELERDVERLRRQQDEEE